MAVARPRWWRRWWRAFRAKLPIYKNITVILLLFGLDIRDIFYKVSWIGPADSFHFRTGSTITLLPDPVYPNVTALNASSADDIKSSWPSFWERCDQITPFCGTGSTFFLSVLLERCQFGQNNWRQLNTSSFIMTTDVRVDSVAWASCSMLYLSRRPPICQEAIVSGFLSRYAFQSVDIPNAWMAQPGTRAELELLAMLDMISESVPLYHIVCGELFPVDRANAAGRYTATLFGCSSPNHFRSEFVGFEHTPLQHLVKDKMWITADIVHFMNVRYGIRQNVRNEFVVWHNAEGTMTLQAVAAVNFSSYGQLYALLVFLDICLVLVHLFSSVEILHWLILPEYLSITTRVRAAMQRRSSVLRSRAPSTAITVTSSSTLVEPPSDPAPNSSQDGSILEDEQLYSFFSRSLYRSERVVIATFVSQIISWLLVLPASVVWTWSDSINQRFRRT